MFGFLKKWPQISTNTKDAGAQFNWCSKYRATIRKLKKKVFGQSLKK